MFAWRIIAILFAIIQVDEATQAFTNFSDLSRESQEEVCDALLTDKECCPKLLGLEIAVVNCERAIEMLVNSFCDVSCAVQKFGLFHFPGFKIEEDDQSFEKDVSTIVSKSQRMQKDVDAKPITRSYLKSFSRIMKKRSPAFHHNFHRNSQTGIPGSKGPAKAPVPAKDSTWDDRLFTTGKSSWLRSLFSQPEYHLNGRDYDIDRIPLRVFLGKRSESEIPRPETKSFSRWLLNSYKRNGEKQANSKKQQKSVYVVDQASFSPWGGK